VTARAEPRVRKPRPSFVVRASFVSQETSFALLGIVSRKFLEVLVPRCCGVARVGRTVLVELDEAERVLRDLAIAGPSVPTACESTDERQPATIDEVLARVGVRRARGRVAR
jgi:hypothetical protein